MLRLDRGIQLSGTLMGDSVMVPFDTLRVTMGEPVMVSMSNHGFPGQVYPPKAAPEATRAVE